MVEAARKPSSETPMHTAILRNFPQVNAVCHTHSPYAIAFSMSVEEVPVANVELLLCGAPIPVAPWTCPGTEANAKVFLLRKHGLVSIGDSLNNAYEFAYDAEIGMQAYYYALSIAEPLPLTQDQVDEVHRAYS